MKRSPKETFLIFYVFGVDSILTNRKPSRSGYGHYEHPKNQEVNQPEVCLNKGYWQYDFPKYLTLGTDQNLTFEASKTKELITLILNREQTHKVFIEPHLKTRMNPVLCQRLNDR